MDGNPEFAPGTEYQNENQVKQGVHMNAPTMTEDASLGFNASIFLFSIFLQESIEAKN